MLRLSSMMGLCILGLALLVGAGYSGDAKKPGGKFRGMLPPGWKSLKLTAAQKQEVYAVQHSYDAKYDELKKKIEELKAQERAEMVRVLTEEQRAQLVKLQIGDLPRSAPKDAKKEKAPPGDKDKK